MMAVVSRIVDVFYSMYCTVHIYIYTFIHLWGSISVHTVQY